MINKFKIAYGISILFLIISTILAKVNPTILNVKCICISFVVSMILVLIDIAVNE